MTPSEVEATTCPACRLGNQAVMGAIVDGRDMVTWECRRCGRFAATGTAQVMLESIPAGKRFMLSAWLREQNEFDREVPRLTSVSLERILDNLPEHSVREKGILLLRAIERRTEHPGKRVKIDPQVDFPLAWARSPGEFGFYLSDLEERGLVQRQQSQPPEFHLTTAGWDLLESEELAPLADRAFVAMWFSEDLLEAWRGGFAPAIASAGYEPYRVDQEPHIDRIDAKIVAEIRSSRFLVADVTGHRQGVYFEAGYALGLGRPVIWTVRKDDLENVHFDTRQYNHVVWREPEDLGQQLFDLIRAVIGLGSRRADHDQ